MMNAGRTPRPELTPMLLEEDRFSRYTAVVTASPQKMPGKFFAFSMHLAVPTTDWLRRSTTPFCWGECGAVRSRFSPS